MMKWVYFTAVVLIAATVVQVQADHKPTNAINQDLGLLAMGKSGTIYQDCSRSMRIASSPSRKIPVCLVGNGMYSLGAINEISGNDWITGDEFTVAQIEEIRFVCQSGTDGITGEAKVYFPNKEESLAGRRVRIEIPCKLNKKNASYEFRKMLNLIRKTFKDPSDVVRNTEEVKVLCDKRPAHAECKRWKTYLSKILSGEAVNRAITSMTYCATQFTVGLSDPASKFIAQQSPKDQTVEEDDPLDELDLTSSIDANVPGSVWSDIFNFTNRFLDSACSVCSEIDPQIPIKRQSCLNQLEKLTPFLKKRGVVIRTDGSYDIGGVKKNRFSGGQIPSDPIVALTESLLGRVETSIECDIDREFSKKAVNPASIKGTQKDWDNSLATVAAPSFFVQVDSESTVVGGGSDSRVTCGWDMDCLKRARVLRDTIMDGLSELRDQGPGCYRIKNAKVSAEGSAKIAFERTSDPCPTPSSY